MPSATIVPDLVVIHPLVLLSVVDHFKRAALGSSSAASASNKRVVGVLLGQWNGRTVNISNSYAVPFEEDENDPNVWFLDHNYHESMNDLFKKVTAKERPVGWYHTGLKLRQSDLIINELFRKYTPNPVLVIVNPSPKELGLPTASYIAVEEIHDDGTATTRTFAHINSTIEAEEAEEIGVEHLLRDMKDSAGGTLLAQISTKVKSLRALQQQLGDIHGYLDRVVAGSLPINHTVVYSLQDMFNLLPDVHSAEAIHALTVNSNDQLMTIYVGSVIRAVIALHDLINNKLEDQQQTGVQQPPAVASVLPPPPSASVAQHD